MSDSPPNPSVHISELVFSSGSVFEFDANDVIVFVGPNNAGKSATLRGIRDKANTPSATNPVVKGIKLQRTGTPKDVEEWVKAWTVRQPESPPDNPIYHALGMALHENQLAPEWQHHNHLGGLSRWFVHLLTADQRLQLAEPPQNIALARDNPAHPIHFLLRDDKLEADLSERFRAAFGHDLVVHRNAGNIVPLHVGERPRPEGNEDRASLSYIQKLERLPQLHLQGDGMRSFAGVLLATSVGRETVVLVDEPEAFLHPPQARQLGGILAQRPEGRRQIFVATHSTDILRGILDTSSKHVRVLRLQRSGTANEVCQLSNEQIKTLWGDPLFRYSNILDGLFHEQVVVCESDGDCRFYSATADAIGATETVRPPDTMFTYCGGKARLATVIRALRSVNVPVAAVADFDVLSDENPLKSIVESLGGQWDEIQTDWRTTKAAIDQKKPDLSSKDVTDEIQAILSSVKDPTFPASAKTRIGEVLRRTSAWAHAKTLGKAFVPHGHAHQACDRLLLSLRRLGLHVVEVGELECFAKSVGGHGPTWVDAVLQRPIATDPELESARQFVKRLVWRTGG